MKAVILAGGQGSRLRPLTCDTPKPLCRLLGKPVIFYILELLKKYGVEEAAITLGYQCGRLESALTDYQGMKLSFLREQTPLGTAGGVRAAMEGVKEDFFIISGDAMCDFNLVAALRFHQEHRAAATLLVKRVEDPREYGLVEADSSGRITAFAEKPSFAACVTDLANTGVYVLSPAALARIPKERPSDFARDLFPVLLSEGLPLYAVREEGYWCDIGDVQSYLLCQKDMLEGKVEFLPAARRERDGLLAGGRLPVGRYKLLPPVFIGRDVSIGAGSVVGPYTVLEDDVRIGEECRVSGSVLQNGTVLGDRVTLENMAACEASAFEDGSHAGAGSVAGAGAVLHRDAALAEGVRIWPGAEVEEGVTLSEDLRHGAARELFMGDEGFSGQTNIAVTPELCARLGGGVASLADFPSIGVGFGSRSGRPAASNAARMLAMGCMSGMMAAGASVWDFGECLESQFAFCLQKSQVDFGVYVDSGLSTQIRVLERCGLPLRRELERKLERAVNRREYKRAAPAGTGGVSELRSLSKLYPFELMKLCDTPLDGLRVLVKSTSLPAREILEDVLRRLGCTVDGAGISIRIAPDGKAASLESGTVVFSPERLLAAVCVSEFLRGEGVALPESAPRAINRLAERYGGKVCHYSESSPGDQDAAARQRAASHPWPQDGMMQVVKLLSFLASRQMSLEELSGLVPDFAVASRLVAVSGNPGAVVRRLRERSALEWADGTSSAYVRPLKSGRGLLILSESFQSETAMELCDRLEAAVREAAKPTT